MDVEEDENFAHALLNNFATKHSAPTGYMNLDFLPCTSALVESFFSQARHTFTSRRSGMIDLNPHLWS